MTGKKSTSLSLCVFSPFSKMVDCEIGSVWVASLGVCLVVVSKVNDSNNGVLACLEVATDGFGEGKVAGSMYGRIGGLVGEEVVGLVEEETVDVGTCPINPLSSPLSLLQLSHTIDSTKSMLLSGETQTQASLTTTRAPAVLTDFLSISTFFYSIECNVLVDDPPFSKQKGHFRPSPSVYINLSLSTLISKGEGRQDI